MTETNHTIMIRTRMTMRMMNVRCALKVSLLPKSSHCRVLMRTMHNALESYESSGSSRCVHCVMPICHRGRSSCSMMQCVIWCCIVDTIRALLIHHGACACRTDNLQKMVHMLEEAADQGYAQAQCNLGHVHERPWRGSGLCSSYHGVEWLQAKEMQMRRAMQTRSSTSGSCTAMARAWLRIIQRR